jgi:micrococcal nuclease
MKNVLKIVILILLVFQISCGVVSEEYTVKYISDGDTITVTNNKTNKKVKVRLFGIDAPEKTQEYGLESKEYLMSLIKDKVIIVKGKHMINMEDY